MSKTRDPELVPGSNECGVYLIKTFDTEQAEGFDNAVQEKNGVRVVLLNLTDDVAIVDQDMEKFFLSLFGSGLPVVLAIDGVVKGSVLKLALDSHLCFATRSTKFDFTKTPRLLPDRAECSQSDVSMVISADQLLDIGLIGGPLVREDVFDLATEISLRIAAMAPLAVKACLESVSNSSMMELEAGMEREVELFAGLFDSNDVRRGTTAFLEKKPAEFKGN